MTPIYLDHAATTPLDPSVREAMLRTFDAGIGNPSSGHLFGRRARAMLDDAAEQIAESIGARRLEEILFTSGGTEADNLALRGIAATLPPDQAIAISEIEHPAVLETAASLESFGRRILRLPVDARGHLDPDMLEQLLQKEKVGLFSLIWANNELGCVQDIPRIAAVCNEANVLFHTDAVQALGRLPVHVREAGVDLLSGSAHKFYGPKGAGFLYVRRGVRIEPCITGGLQQNGLRGGTENLSGAVGTGHALQLACEGIPEESPRLCELAEIFLKELGSFPGMQVNSRGHELPGHLSLSFEDVEGEALLLSLDLDGIAVSSGSACHTGSMEASHVLLAVGLGQKLAKGTIRLVAGRSTSSEEMRFAAGRIREHAERLRGTL